MFTFSKLFAAITLSLVVSGTSALADQGKSSNSHGGRRPATKSQAKKSAAPRRAAAARPRTGGAAKPNPSLNRRPTANGSMAHHQPKVTTAKASMPHPQPQVAKVPANGSQKAFPSSPTRIVDRWSPPAKSTRIVDKWYPQSQSTRIVDKWYPPTQPTKIVGYPPTNTRIVDRWYPPTQTTRIVDRWYPPTEGTRIVDRWYPPYPPTVETPRSYTPGISYTPVAPTLPIPVTVCKPSSGVLLNACQACEGTAINCSAEPASVTTADCTSDAQEAIEQVTRYLQLQNNTDDTITFSICCYITDDDGQVCCFTEDENGQWGWFVVDEDSDTTPLVRTVATGGACDLSQDDVLLSATWMRISAVSACGKTVVESQDCWLVPEVDCDGVHHYSDCEVGTYRCVLSSPDSESRPVAP
jgi:hypothetical protein